MEKEFYTLLNNLSTQSVKSFSIKKKKQAKSLQLCILVPAAVTFLRHQMATSTSNLNCIIIDDA